MVLRKSADSVGERRWPSRSVTKANLDKAEAWFKAQGLPVAWVDAPLSGAARCARAICFGIPLEFYSKMDRLPPIHQQYALYKGVKPLRIDHFNCFSPDVDAGVAFYNEIGFRVTEYTEDDETGRLWAAWMHRKGGVHDIAFTNGTGPRLHHTAFWVPTPLNIIDLLDLMATTGYVSNIERGPGRHGISNAFFLYIRDPDGHRIEIYCSDYQTVDPDLEPIKWDLKDPQRQTLWGAAGAATWFEHGSVFDGVGAGGAILASLAHHSAVGMRVGLPTIGIIAAQLGWFERERNEINAGRIAAFRADGQDRYGVVTDDGIVV